MNPIHHSGGRRDEPVQSVTTAAAGRSNDLRSRQTRYLWMMGVRLACLPLAVITSGWLRWVFIAGAVILPYIAVVIVNAASRPAAGVLESVPPPAQRELPAGTQSTEPNDQKHRS
ncbi:DUF3099 domain-containing protein [Phytoactinopolyspora alkaliphila]|uniref:DUF3099 domain-containing protein n=1 Tax=Phytoactinopolyspora alkaliphila TaxID=1783498 RepID=A0A6N9YRB4_9ACTN|nr:DUF3099 domain-containing protein [Phytoactinopolyspora alkaliphila]